MKEGVGWTQGWSLQRCVNKKLGSFEGGSTSLNTLRNALNYASEAAIVCSIVGQFKRIIGVPGFEERKTQCFVQ
jgi:hypothetical protein